MDDEESIRAIHAALDAGIDLIDTAANYGTGHSEQIVGRAVKGRRDKLVIATKFGFDVDESARKVKFYPSAGDILDNLFFECERSLRNLDMDVIDLYQLHMWKFPIERIPELLEKLEMLVTQGKIRYYGWSTDEVELAKAFSVGAHCVSIQYSANVLEPAADMFSFVNSASLAGLIRSPLLMGFLADKYTPESNFPSTDVRNRSFKPDRIAAIVANRTKVREALASGGRTVAQGALVWLLSQGDQIIPIPGIRTPAQAIENATAMQYGLLSPAQMEEIEMLLGRRE